MVDRAGQKRLEGRTRYELFTGGDTAFFWGVALQILFTRPIESAVIGVFGDGGATVIAIFVLFGGVIIGGVRCVVDVVFFAAGAANDTNGE